MINRLAVAGPNSRYGLADAQPAGFWAGLWHGIIAPIAFIVGLFQPGVRMYEVRNAGWRYDLGFLLGIVAVVGGGGSRTGVCTY
jgi:hypothetical protein